MLEQFLIYMCLKKKKKVVWVLSRKQFLESMFALDIERLTLFYSVFIPCQIYFMCSAEVCLPAEKRCDERCFDGRVSL